MKVTALVGIFLSAALATACDLSPQPLPPGAEGATSPMSGSGSGTGGASSGGASTSGTAAPGTGGVGAEADAASPPIGSITTTNGGDAGAGLVNEAGFSIPADASIDAPTTPADGALDGAQLDGEPGDASLDGARDASDAAADATSE
jgi:hypothetical protein